MHADQPMNKLMISMKNAGEITEESERFAPGGPGMLDARWARIAQLEGHWVGFD
jgi:hypothetical protein